MYYLFSVPAIAGFARNGRSMDSTEINPVGSAETRLYDSMVIVPAGQRAAHSPQRMHRDSSFSTSYALLGLSALRAHGTQSPPTRKLIWCDPVNICRSEEHTSELQSLRHLVCRLLLEK